MNPNILNLKKDYLNGKIVPFIGAGLSVPFKVPTWRGLIEEITCRYAVDDYKFLLDSVKILLDRNEFWEAIEQLKTFVHLSDQDIQSLIVEIIENQQIQLDNDMMHNYKDISEMNFQVYLTTNYEELIYKYLNIDTVPMLLKDIDFSTQILFDKKRVFHLHGHLTNPGSIVISQSSYKELYESNKYKNLLKAITSTKKLLFIGFSFDDQFIQKLILDHKEFFKGEHYIMLDNPSEEKIRELKSNYGLTTIKYDSSKSSHTEEIRMILHEIKETNGHKEIMLKKNNLKDKRLPVIGAQIIDMEREVESNLFYQKLKIEDIDDAFIELSAAFYIVAEIYIRDLKRNGMSIEVINAILAKVFIKYKEKYCDIYLEFGDSEKFVKEVHKSLEKIEWGRYSQFFSEHEVSNEDENRGFIHILADDESKDIWWGRKRIK